MRKLRWLIGIGVVIVLIGFAFAMKRPSDPLAELAPYITLDVTYNYNAKNATKRWGRPNMPVMSEREVRLKNISESQLLDFLNRYASKENGWTEPSPHSPGRDFHFTSLRRPRFYEAIVVTRGTFRPNGFITISPDDRVYSIKVSAPLSVWDIVLLRLRNPGMDPFTQHPTPKHAQPQP